MTSATDLAVMAQYLGPMGSETAVETRDLVIVGAGRFAPEGIWVAEDMNAASIGAGKRPLWKIHGFVVFDPAGFPETLYSYPVLGTAAQAAAAFQRRQVSFICMIGDNKIREQQAREAENVGWTPVTLVHPSAVIARETVIAPGCYIGAGAIVSPFARLGAHVVINHHVSVGHESVMEDFSQACPGVRISGKCIVGKSALLGSNATLLPGCKVGNAGVVGAGSVVLRSVPASKTVVGVPAKILDGSKNQEHTN